MLTGMGCGDAMTFLLMGFAMTFGVVSGLIAAGAAVILLMWLGRKLGL